MIHDPRRTKVSVDDLIKVKKGERPHREFWSDWQSSFDARFSMVQSERRPWWKDLIPRAWIFIAKRQLPISLCGLGVLGFIAFSQLSPSDSVVVPKPSLPRASTSSIVSTQIRMTATAGATQSSSLAASGSPHSDESGLTALFGVDPLGAIGTAVPKGSLSCRAANVSVFSAFELSSIVGQFAGDSYPASRAVSTAESSSYSQQRRGNLGFSYAASIQDVPAATIGSNALDEERLYETVARRITQKGERGISLKF